MFRCKPLKGRERERMGSPEGHVRVPGKLMIAGEYAVLSPHQQAVVVAINRYVNVTVTNSDRHCLRLPNLDMTWQPSASPSNMAHDDTRLRFADSAISTVLQYLDDPHLLADPFDLTIVSELADEHGKKYGLGSSAAVVVGIITALLRRANGCQAQPSPMLIYKLSMIAHFRVQGSGSGADVAAAVFGGWLCYSAFSSEWLATRIHNRVPIRTLVQEPWPRLSIAPLSFSSKLSLLAGWSGHPVATAPLVRRVQTFQHQDPKAYQIFLQESEKAVTTLLTGICGDDIPLALRGMNQNRKALIQLGEKADVAIETPKLATLALAAESLGGAGKSSGAGAGDCGIAFIEPSQADKLTDLWREKDIQPLPLQVTDHGVQFNEI